MRHKHVPVVLTVLILLAGAAAQVRSSNPNTYVSAFPLTENPMRESGNWIEGHDSGQTCAGDYCAGNVATNGTMAYGVDLPPGAQGYGDPTALVSGNWGPNQTAFATVKRPGSPSNVPEAELRLRMTVQSGGVYGYETYCSMQGNGSGPYCHIARWNGIQSNGATKYCNIEDNSGANQSVGEFLKDGDQLKATVTGTNPVSIRLYYQASGTTTWTQVAYVDSTGTDSHTDGNDCGSGKPLFTSGNPGLGFFASNSSDFTKFGLTNFAATDGAQLIGFMDLRGASGSTPTAATLLSGTHSPMSLTWVQDGAAAFTYQTTSSQPLAGTVLVGTTNYTDSSTTGIQMATGSSTNSDWHWGTENVALAAGQVIGAAVNLSSTLPPTDTSHFDVLNIRGFDGATHAYMNAMLGGDGVNRWISLEPCCGSTQDLSVADAPVTMLPSNVYHVEFIYNPHIGTVTVSGNTVTRVSGPNFDNNLLNGLGKIYITTVAPPNIPTSNAYTIASVNSANQLTLVSGPANGSYNYYAANYMKVYVGWQNPSYPGTLISTQYAASSGQDIGRIDFGNAQGVQGTSGFTVNWDTILMSANGPVSAGPSPKICYAGGSPNSGSSGLTSSAVQTALTACASGGNVVLGAGSATWSSNVSVNVTGPLTIIGQTQCTAGCNPGSEGAGLAFTDGTSLTLSTGSEPELGIFQCSATNFCRVTGITFSNTTGGGATQGALHIEGTHAQVGTRVDNLHVSNSNGTFLSESQGYGLIDHILYSGNGDYTATTFGGDFGTSGYQNWIDSTNLGTSDGYIVEDNNFTFLLNSSHSSVMDGYFGCKATIRHNQITGGDGAGMNHGTDSGGYRSCVAMDVYNNTYTSNGSNVGGQGAGFNWQSRGGVSLFHNNVLNGPTQWRGIEIDYYRADPNGAGVAQPWGFAVPGANWTPSALRTQPNVLNPHPSAWASGTFYAVGANVINGGANYVNVGASCTASTAPTAGFPGTSSDGACTWRNVGGGTASPPGSAGTNAGFLNTDNETPCTSGSTCTRFFDTNNTGYPYRDQPCVAHGQTVYGCYQWGNSGSGAPANYWGTDDSSIIQLNRDYFNSTPSGYTAFTYPDPLTGPATVSGPTYSISGTVSGVVITPVTVTLTGAASGSTTTDSSGNYSFSGLSNGAYTVTPSFASGYTFSPASTSVTISSANQTGKNFTSIGPVVSLSPSSLTYGSQIVGTNSPTQTATLQNTGTGSLTISSITASGDFSQTNTCSSTLAAGASCTISVTFSPTAVGTRNGTLSVVDNAIGSPHTVALTGVGISPAAMFFTGGVAIQGGTSIR